MSALLHQKARDLYEGSSTGSLKENYAGLFARFRDELARTSREDLQRVIPSRPGSPARTRTAAAVRPEDVTVLHYVAGAGCVEACQLVLERCPKLNYVRDEKGRTPLCWAVKHGYRTVVDQLLEHGADADGTDLDGRTTLHVAAAAGFARIVEILLERCDPSTVDARGTNDKTPLHVAAAHGHLDVCEQLVKAQADCSVVTEKSRTPLHLAVITGAAGVIPFLLDTDGSCPFVRDAEGKRPIDYAEKGDGSYPLLLQAEDCLHKWQWYLQPFRELDTANATLELQPPKLVQVEWFRLRLQARVFDREHVIASYCLEMRPVAVHGYKDHAERQKWKRGAESGKTRRWTYQPSPRQRKVDELRFELPRFREVQRAHYTAWGLDDGRWGCADWEACPEGLPTNFKSDPIIPKGEYEFRLLATLELTRWGPRSLASDWSLPTSV